MWIEITGGPRSLWVRSDECRLADGDLAFVNKPGPPPALPEWLEAPVDSRLRASDSVLGFPLMECRSMRAKASQILAFYRGCIQRGRLALTEGQGLSAENDEYTFGLDIYEHNDLAFWTIQLCSKVRQRRAVLASDMLLVARNDERLTLRNQYTAEEYWAPVTAVRDSEPPDARPEPARSEPILWSSLPGWIQFDMDGGNKGEKHGVEQWNATIKVPLNNDPTSAFARCLDSLDAHGFDGSGTQQPDRSYFVSVLQRGHSLNAHIRSETGDRATATVLNTLGHVTLFLRYSPP
jgi:hypothetical protein